MRVTRGELFEGEANSETTVYRVFSGRSNRDRLPTSQFTYHLDVEHPTEAAEPLKDHQDQKRENDEAYAKIQDTLD